ncbi:site-specific integrase [Pseudomonas sp. Q1-7]|uniref:site-specific integrase n=1 Tax=Pseudomonas sp. Q1-7 TaxID=3020843 RepID=UPI002301B6A3|nr:site-specific integrase [Pseudomonas sp. Q1-7]
MPAQPAYITLNRHGTFYFRIVVPSPVRTALGLQREIRRSLKTDSQRLALRRARQFAARYEAAFDKVLSVIDRDDYQLTAEDMERAGEVIEQAGRPISWGSWASEPEEPTPPSKSALSDADWRQVEMTGRLSEIALALTGSATRPIPEHQQALADYLLDWGLPLPHQTFKRGLAKQIEAFALRRVGSLSAAPMTPTLVPEPVTGGPTLYELWELQREAEVRLNKKKSPSAHVDEQGHARRLNILSGNRPFGSLSLDDINQLYLLTQQVKSLRGGKIPPPDSPIESILANPGDSLISGPTIEKMIVRLGAIHRFAYKKGYSTVDPARTETPSVSSDAGRIAREDKPFTTRELQTIFSGYLYTGTDSGSAELVFPYQFWLPLLALFTGGRLNELCQLESSDISQEAETGIWFVRIVSEGSKSLKNQYSRRFIPLHNELIRIGFLEFVQQAKSEGRLKLFSDGLTYKPTKGWGGIATTFFTRIPSDSTKSGGYFNAIGIRKRLDDGKPDGKRFHAFRHTFVDLLRNTSDQALPLIPVFTGHAAKNRNQSDDYGSGFWLKKLSEALHTVSFPVDLSGITYADFELRLGHLMTSCIQAHRDTHGLNP